ncbi:hypothetical protein L6164_012529 [Bauhinia variegata]|uniref:Uncharacterized protein n=1 Tax=Bauhinia variegata TaxID=167791 RepID=A0ACB9PAN4_BAUVA|nr:hypothetical protein L6164_012529 [Bauhinia variegata]
MALKYFFVMSLLIATTTLHSTKTQGMIGDILGMILIKGNVECSESGNVTRDGTPAPPFPNADVQLQCGGKMVSNTTTDDAGDFEIRLDPLQFITYSLLTGCQLVVTSPLSHCDATLPPVGGLVSTLQLMSSTVIGDLQIANLVPSGFLFNPKVHH